MKNLLIGLVILSFTQFAHAADEPAVRIVALGDSITRGVRAGVTKEQTFAHLLQQALRRNKIQAEVINKGIGGEQTDGALARLDKDVIALKPVVVVVMYGTNDSYIYPKKTAPNLTPQQFRDNLTTIVGRLRKARIEPVLMTEPCWGDKATKNAIGEHHNVGLEKYMAISREVARATKTPLVDNFAHWSARQKDGTDLATWTTDLCHPNARGHQEIANLLIPVVTKMVDKK